MTEENNGGYRMLFQKGAEERMALRPNTRYIKVGLNDL